MKDNREYFNPNVNSNPNLNEMPIEVSEDFVNAYIDATKMNAPDLWSRIDAGFDNEVEQMKAEQESNQTKTNIYNFPAQNNFNANENISAISEEPQQIKKRKKFNYGRFGVIAAGILAIVIAVPVLSNITSGSKSENFSNKGDNPNYSSDIDFAQEETDNESAFADSLVESEDVNGLRDGNKATKNFLNAETKDEKMDSISNWTDGKDGVGSAESAPADDMAVLASFEGEFIVLQEDDGVYISVVDVIYLEEISNLEDDEIKNDKYLISNYSDFEKMCADKEYEVLSGDDTKIGEIIIYSNGANNMCVVTSIK